MGDWRSWLTNGQVSIMAYEVTCSTNIGREGMDWRTQTKRLTRRAYLVYTIPIFPATNIRDQMYTLFTVAQRRIRVMASL
jgi:hypothetical protein